jgi:hypothetical protein
MQLAVLLNWVDRLNSRPSPFVTRENKKVVETKRICKQGEKKQQQIKVARLEYVQHKVN